MPGGVGKPGGRLGGPLGAPSQGLAHDSTSTRLAQKDESGGGFKGLGVG